MSSPSRPKVADGATIDLPASFEHTYDGSTYGAASFFVYDAADTNELTSATDGAAGTLVFERASRDPTPAIDVRIGATLESELLDGQQVRVHGRLTLGDGT